MVGQLIRIHTTQGQIDINTTNMSWRKTGETGQREPKLEVSTEKGQGLKIKTTQGKLETNMGDVLDSERPFRIGTTIDKYSAEGESVCAEATREMADMGWQLMQPGGDQYIPDHERSKLITVPEFELTWTPSVPLKIEYTPGKVEQEFDPDKVHTKQTKGSNPYEFVPGNVEVSLKTKPEVTIEYIGGPNRFPRSSLGHIDMLV